MTFHFLFSKSEYEQICQITVITKAKRFTIRYVHGIGQVIETFWRIFFIPFYGNISRYDYYYVLRLNADRRVFLDRDIE